MDSNHHFVGQLHRRGKLPFALLCHGELRRQHSPSADNEAQGVQVAMVGGPQGGGHAILIRRVQVLLGGFLQQVQVAVPGRSVVLVIHGGQRFPGEHMGAQGAQGVGMGKGSCQKGPVTACSSALSRTPDKRRQGGRDSFQPSHAL